MIQRLRRLSFRRRHPASRLLSEYLDGELAIGERRALDAHLSGCDRCRRLLDSLRRTVDALGSLERPSSSGIADSVIAALRAEVPAQPPTRHAPALTVVGRPVGTASDASLRDRARAAIAFCCQRRQLRATLPVAVLTGVVLSIANQGGMLLDGRIDLGMCAMCASDFLVPFLAFNVALVLIVRPFGRSGL